MSILPELIQTMEGYDEYVYVNSNIVDDGQGGTVTEWIDGAHFFATLTLQSSDEMRIAQAQGLNAIYTVTAPRDILLPWHTVFKRLSDGQIFRVTSKDANVAPNGSVIKTRIVTAEEWELPVNE